MELNKLLKPGNEVRVKNEKGSFITYLDEVIDEDTLTVIAPDEAEKRLLMKPGETFLFSCVTDRGLYMFETQVTAIQPCQNVTLIEMKAVSDYKKIQRREAFRAKECIEVSIRRKPKENEKAGKWLNTSTVDISEKGMLLKFNEECYIGQLMEFVLRVDIFGIKEVLPKIDGRVVRCMETGNKHFGYLLGINFENLPEKVRNIIIKLVVLSQRSKLTYKYTKRY
ncbi:Flagellar brake protein YcgR [bioreactor metagenome]|uniref:Flagellar brake protein YcgR n=1 Tax=bioreactor metagenome TaxID=1076179 RepID=A0A644Z452_9ZZZZ